MIELIVLFTMKVITCASYHGTGSSALTDLITEYSGVKSLGDYEFPFLYAMDGISDLEFHLVQCPDRHLSGYALQRFQKLAIFNSGKWFNKRYEPFFNNHYLNHTNQYIQSLIEFTIPGSCFYAEYDKGMFLYYLNSLKRKFLKLFHLSTVNRKEEQWFSHQTIDEFLKKTRDYTRGLFSEAIGKESDILMIDQLMPSSNVERCLRYVDDNVYVFIIDRDPRDVFLTNKYIWKESNVPTDPYEFCRWFKFTHECEDVTKIRHPRVKLVYFEDLIYKYDETVRDIEFFCGLKSLNHIDMFRKFNPKRSIVNTRTWEKYEDDGVFVIEKELSKYLYAYDKINDNNIKGLETRETGLF